MSYSSIKLTLIVLTMNYLVNLTIAQSDNKIAIYFASSDSASPVKEINPDLVELDSILLSSQDLLKYDHETFEFTLTTAASNRIGKKDLEGQIFCITKNDEKILAGYFWPCNSSIGMTGFVTFNTSCHDNENKLRIRYCLGSKDYPDNDPRKKITIANNGYK